MFTAFLIYALVGWLIIGFCLILNAINGAAEEMYVHCDDEVTYIFGAIIMVLMFTLFWPIFVAYGIIEVYKELK